MIASLPLAASARTRCCGSPCLLLAALVAATIPNAASAELLLSGNSMNWNPLVAPSPTHVISVANTDASPDLLVAWQIGLRIVGTVDAVGTVEFSSLASPPSYLLAGRSQGLTPAVSLPTDDIFTVGDNDLLSGIAVPPGPVGLLALEFVASSGASGTFSIQAVGGEFRSIWVSDDFTGRDYSNLPNNSSLVLGTLTIVPEPHGAVLLAIGALLWAVIRRSTCRRGAT